MCVCVCVCVFQRRQPRKQRRQQQVRILVLHYQVTLLLTTLFTVYTTFVHGPRITGLITADIFNQFDQNTRVVLLPLRRTRRFFPDR